MVQKTNVDWEKRVKAIFLKIRNVYSLEGPFYMLNVIEYLIKNSMIDKAKEYFNYLDYSVDKHSAVLGLDENILSLYRSSAFFDLKIHMKPSGIYQSEIRYYMNRVEEYLISEDYGYSSWLYEVHKKNVIRQVVKFDNMPCQNYSYAYFEDDNGGLATQKLEDDYIDSLISIDQTQFEKVWNNSQNK